MNQEFLDLVMTLPKQVAEAVLAEHERIVADMKRTAENWESQYRNAEFGTILREVIHGARGRNYKAIAALLDVDAIRSAEDVHGAAWEAVEQLKKEHGYLFELPGVPGYAPGTGAMDPGDGEEPQSLAQALREKFGM